MAKSIYSMSLILFRKLKPPDNWKVPVGLLIAVFCGLSAYAVYISKFTSYLGSESKTCINCHIMSPQYISWSRSSHFSYTNCNDCHVPHDNIFSKYYFKAKDGMRHATIFTFRGEPQAIIAISASCEVIQENCERCHYNVMSKDKIAAIVGNAVLDEKEGERRCWDCHREVPHGKVRSLSSAPNALVPLPESPVPSWLNELIRKEKSIRKK